MSKVLIAEDDRHLGALLAEFLDARGFETQLEERGDRVVAKVRDEKPAVVVLDLMLPGLDGISVCEQLRPDYTGGILMLTAQKGQDIELRGLEAGADDFVQKPVDPRVLVARLHSLTRRLPDGSGDAPPETIEAGPLVVDTSRREARAGDEPLRLTGTELDILWALVANSGRPVSRDDLYLKVHGVEYDGLDRGIDIHISRLRKKLRESAAAAMEIKSIRGQGYQLVGG